MMNKKIMEVLNTVFDGIELIVKSKIHDEINNDIFNDENNIALTNADLKKSLEKLLRKAKRNYSDAKKLYYSGKISEDELHIYKKRITEILNEINNLNF